MNEDIPDADESFTLLHRSGWSVGEVAEVTSAGVAWLVTGSNGENLLEVRGSTQVEAWRSAVKQAAAIGMAGRR